VFGEVVFFCLLLLGCCVSVPKKFRVYFLFILFEKGEKFEMCDLGWLIFVIVIVGFFLV